MGAGGGCLREVPQSASDKMSAAPELNPGD